MTEPEPRTFVTDASVAIKWYLRDERWTAEADHLLDLAGDGTAVLVAPPHFRIEVAAAITVASRQDPPRIDRATGGRFIDGFLMVPVSIIEPADFLIRSFEFAHQYRISFYDAGYLVVAAETGFSLVTADTLLYERTRDTSLVLWIDEIL